MEKCIQCGADYIPRRRGVQKFCSDTCRSRHWQLKQGIPKKKKKKPLKKKKHSLQKYQKEKITFAGISNAAIGQTAVDLIKNIATPESKKPATKGDINELKSLIKGNLLPIKNMENNAFGKSPFYDVTNQIVIFI
ncbi:hypothetical protein KXJ69_05325 [Aureisphaera sp. CAU 1614]|uniref:Uncharacterized protein n=1 Tax=Halomarinibacterium sedimenti TaxID=2857106 RepID=A0A9X1FNC0_9FLAO|nr:hypothetical protein [Halomarinibacterium sedimenti]MBW2937515.1 hypothetical protein [Halomarinibacterium sedimenti]